MKGRKYIIELISKIKTLNSSNLENLFEAFFTPQELDNLEMRYQLIQELINNKTQRDIAKKLNISVSQITRGSRELKYGVGKDIFPKLFSKNISILNEIIENKINEVKSLKIKIPKNIDILKLSKISSFYDSLKNADRKFGIITEIKIKSPSKGLITNSKHKEIAAEYIKSNVNAISILTDKKYFCGKMQDIVNVHKITNIPILCKDFIINKKQIYQARLAGASAILLIVRILKDLKKIERLMNFATKLGMDSLIEVSNEDELKIALSINSKIIGVNSRNLDTLTIDKDIFQILFPKIPNNILKLALSGIETKNDISKIKNICNGALIGTSLCSLSLDQIESKINEFRLVL